MDSSKHYMSSAPMLLQLLLRPLPKPLRQLLILRVLAPRRLSANRFPVMRAPHRLPISRSAPELVPRALGDVVQQPGFRHAAHERLESTAAERRAGEGVVQVRDDDARVQRGGGEGGVVLLQFAGGPC